MRLYTRCIYRLSTNPLYPPLVGVVHIQRYRTHLDCVSIICRILKQTVVWIEHLTRQKEKELPRRTAIIQTETAKKIYCYQTLFWTEWFSNNDRGKTETREFTGLRK